MTLSINPSLFELARAGIEDSKPEPKAKPAEKKAAGKKPAAPKKTVEKKAAPKAAAKTHSEHGERPLTQCRLPERLERLSKVGKRSDFIQKAIRSRLDNQDKFDLWDVDDKEILKFARAIAIKNNDEVLQLILSNRLEALE